MFFRFFSTLNRVRVHTADTHGGAGVAFGPVCRRRRTRRARPHPILLLIRGHVLALHTTVRVCVHRPHMHTIVLFVPLVRVCVLMDAFEFHKSLSPPKKGRYVGRARG